MSLARVCVTMINQSTVRAKLLNLYAHLSKHGASFADGDIAVDDTDGAIFEQLCVLGASVSGTWWEMTLVEPLTALCPCVVCTARGDYKSALLFRRHQGFLLIRLVRNPWYTLEGGLEKLRQLLGGHTPYSAGCSGGWRSSELLNYEQRSMRQDIEMHRSVGTAERLRTYNTTYRLGNEVYVPLLFWTTDAVATLR